MRSASAVAVLAAALVLPLPAGASGSGAPHGDYLEARSAEVFAGGCVMGSEAETAGRQAVLAWRIRDGAFAGVPLAGLSVVAALEGDRNLGIRELGGLAPREVRAEMLVDERADPRQRDALVAFARAATGDLIDRVVAVRAVPVAFGTGPHGASVAAGAARLEVVTHVHHDASCGATRWYGPLAAVDGAEVGIAREVAYRGEALDVRWVERGRKAAFFARF